MTVPTATGIAGIQLTFSARSWRAVIVGTAYLARLMCGISTGSLTGPPCPEPRDKRSYRYMFRGIVGRCIARQREDSDGVRSQVARLRGGDYELRGPSMVMRERYKRISLSVQSEIHLNCAKHPNWVPVCQHRSVSPLPHGVDRSGRELLVLWYVQHFDRLRYALL